MPVYKYDRNHARLGFGTTIGILITGECQFPFIPGDVGNASSYEFPVRYEFVEGMSIPGLLAPDLSVSDAVIGAARALECAGVAAISSNCGFMSVFQKRVAAAVSVPVLLSSLLQVPWVYRMLPKHKRIGIVTAHAGAMRENQRLFFDGAGIDDSIPVVLAGMEDKPAFLNEMIREGGTIDTDDIEREVVEVASALVQTNPDIGAIVLECSDLPPYAAAVQEAVRLPVFDFMTMINYVHAACARKAYRGTMY